MLHLLWVVIKDTLLGIEEEKSRPAGIEPISSLFSRQVFYSCGTTADLSHLNSYSGIGLGTNTKYPGS